MEKINIDKDLAAVAELGKNHKTRDVLSIVNFVLILMLAFWIHEIDSIQKERAMVIKKVETQILQSDM